MDPIRFELQPKGKKLWFLRPTTSTSRILEPRPKVLISSVNQTYQHFPSSSQVPDDWPRTTHPAEQAVSPIEHRNPASIFVKSTKPIIAKKINFMIFFSMFLWPVQKGEWAKVSPIYPAVLCCGAWAHQFYRINIGATSFMKDHLWFLQLCFYELFFNF